MAAPVSGLVPSYSSVSSSSTPADSSSSPSSISSSSPSATYGNKMCKHIIYIWCAFFLLDIKEMAKYFLVTIVPMFHIKWISIFCLWPWNSTMYMVSIQLCTFPHECQIPIFLYWLPSCKSETYLITIAK
jgi:hypothetical protein